MIQPPNYTPEKLKPHMESLAYELVNNKAVKNIYDTFLGEKATNETIFITTYFIISQAILGNILYIKTEKKRVDIPYNAIENLEQLVKSLGKTRGLLSNLRTYECDWINTQAKYSTNQQVTLEIDESLTAIQNQINDNIKSLSRSHPKRKSPYFSVIDTLYSNFKHLRFDLLGITQLSPSKANHYHPISTDDWVFFQAIVTRVFHEIFDYFLHNKNYYTSNHADVKRGIEPAFSQVKE